MSRRFAWALLLVPACTFEPPYSEPGPGPGPDPNSGSMPEPRSCRDLDRSQASGFYAIDTDGAGDRPPFEVYCDMSIAGGGWTLVGRSVSREPKAWPSPSEYILIGWSSETGNPRSDDMPYSLDAHGAGITFESILVGAYESGRTWSRDVYQLDVPPDFFTACATEPCASSPRPVLGGCGDTPSGVRRWVGRVFDNGFFYIGREGSSGEREGLYGSGFRLGGDDCTIHGGLEGAQGMIFVR